MSILLATHIDNDKGAERRQVGVSFPTSPLNFPTAPTTSPKRPFDEPSMGDPVFFPQDDPKPAKLQALIEEESSNEGSLDEEKDFEDASEDVFEDPQGN